MPTHWPRPTVAAWQAKPAKAIARALALQPKHLKGLWLAASLDMELPKYHDALGRWQQLRAALPEGSPDVAIIDANIAEAQRPGRQRRRRAGANDRCARTCRASAR